MSRSFPDNPNNNDYHTAKGRKYKYNSSKNRWVNVTTNEEEIQTLNTHIANPPTYEEDPSDVGAFWYDSDADVLYVCTDNTPGDNVWKGVQIQGHLVKLVVPWQGTNYGYLTHGEYPNVSKNTIQKISLTSGTGSSCAGTLTMTKHYSAGISDINNAVGYTGAGYSYPANTTYYSYEKFSMNSDGSASGAAVAGTALYQVAHGMQDPNREYGYNFYGTYNNPNANLRINGEKFPFAAGGGDTAYFGDLDSSWQSTGVACGSADYGYVAGSGISKIPYASEDSCTSVGATTLSRTNGGGCSSEDYGYVVGGNPNYRNTIDRFPFASDTNASDVGDLSVGRYTNATISSTTYGYTAGGRNPSPSPSIISPSRIIERFPFASLGNASNHGYLDSCQKTLNKAGGQQF